MPWSRLCRPAAGTGTETSRPGASHRCGLAGPSTPRSRSPSGASARVSGSVGTIGDVYDNALAEPVIGLFKTELIKPRGPWRTAEQVEIAALEYIDWFNNRRL